MAMGKPQSPDAHTYDKLALKNLVSVFPEHWNIVRIVDVFSNFEYGQDWLVQLTDEMHYVTGAEFRVQSKTTAKIGNRRIGVNIKVKTLRYLFGLSSPVMLHIVHRPTETGYWMWLTPYLAEHNRPEWKPEKEVRVYIPTRNILNENAIEQIRAYVEKHWHSRALLEQTEAASQPHSKFAFDFARIHRTDKQDLIEQLMSSPLPAGTILVKQVGYGEDVINITMRAKDPLVGDNASVEFKLLLDKNAENAFRTTLATGEPATFPGRIVFTSQGLPDFIEEDAGKQMEFTIRTYAPDETLQIKVEYFDEDEVPLESSFVLLKATVPWGYRVNRWQGMPSGQPIVYTLVRDAQSGTWRFQVGLKPDMQSPLSCKRGLDFLAMSKRAKRVVFTILEPKETVVFDSFSRTEPSISEEFSRLVRALATIEAKLGIPIPIPNECTFDALEMTEEIANILRYGSSSKLSPFPKSGRFVLSTKGNAEFLNYVLSTFDKNGSVDLPSVPGHLLGYPDAQMELLGHHLFLGPTQWTFLNLKPHDLDSLREHFERGDTEIEIVFDIDTERIHIEFLNWLPEEENAAA